MTSVNNLDINFVTMSNSPNLHNKVVHFSTLSNSKNSQTIKQTILPKRSDFVSSVIVKHVDDILSKKKPLSFLPNYLLETHMQDVQYGKSSYKIVLTGVLLDGRKVNVVVTGIEPYFEVRIPDVIDVQTDALNSKENNTLVKNVDGKMVTQTEYINKLRSLLNKEETTKPFKTTVVKAKPFKYYQENQSKFLRFYYTKTHHKTQSNRLEALNTVIKHGYETATDDKSCYYRVVCRDELTTFSSWAELTDYEEVNNPSLKGTTYNVNIKNYKTYTGELTDNHKKDLSVSLCWDIETYGTTGDIPQPENLKDKIFCIGMTFQFVHQKEPFWKVCLCDLPANAKPDYLTVVCDNEENIIKTFATIFESMMPEFVFGFNDSDYDWNWLIKRAANTKGLLSYLADHMTSVNNGVIPFPAVDDMTVLKWNFKKERVKLEADSYADGTNLMLHGYIPMDVRTVFRQLYKTAEQSSLKWFLAKNKLGGKDDMDYRRMSQSMIKYYDFIDRYGFADNYKFRKQSDDPEVKKRIANIVSQLVEQDGKINSEGIVLQGMPRSKAEAKARESLNKKHLTVSCDFNLTGKKYIQGDDELIFRVSDKRWTPLLDKYSSIEEEYADLKKELAEINKYCVVDALRCHDLMLIRCVITDKREVSHLSYVSVYDAFYRADGMKVRNLTIAIGQQFPFFIRFTNVTKGEFEEGKYPGAFVFAPKKGLKTSKLSIEERCKKAEVTKNTKLPAEQAWLNTSEKEKNEYHQFVEKYGACKTTEEIATIEKETKKKLPKKFHDFLTEEIGRPIAGLDFSSLYPSLIRTYNFSPEYCILDKKKAKELHEVGVKLTRVEFEYGGRLRKGWFVHHNNEFEPIVNGKPNEKFRFGVYPYILNDLFNKRAVIKKQMKVFMHRKEELEAIFAKDVSKQKLHQEEYDNIVFDINYINCKQNALKVFMNTFYGSAGSQMSPFFVVEVAGGITQYGKQNIQLAHSFVTKQGCRTYYGDSVTPNTPILIKINGKCKFVEIEDLINYTEKQYTNQPQGKEVAWLDEDDTLEVWSDTGFIKVNKIIRHKTDKDLYRVLTHTGFVTVTKDHSLLNEESKKIKPTEVKVGSKLLHKELPTIRSTNNVSITEAKALGVFTAHGIANVYHGESGQKGSWRLPHPNKDYLEEVKTWFEEIELNYKFKIIKDKDNNVLIPIKNPETGAKVADLARKYMAMCYYKKNYIIPYKILAGSQEARYAFFDTYCITSGLHAGVNEGKSIEDRSYRLNIRSQISASSFCMLFKQLNIRFTLNYDFRRSEGYIINTCPNRGYGKDPTTIKKIEKLKPTLDYVYDLETETHHFSAGVGNMVVSNTDSLYISMPEPHFDTIDKKYYSNQISKLEHWTKMVEISFKVIKNVKDLVNSMFFEDNGTRFLLMDFEEFLYPVAFTAKKKYFGIAHENIANFKPKDLFVRGLEVKKRGVSDLLKEIFNSIMWTCCSVENFYDLLELVQMKIDEIYSKTWEMKYFIQTDVYRPIKHNVKVQTFVRRMKEERNLDVKPNERFSYVIAKKYPYAYDYRGRKIELGVGDKMEYLETMQEEKLSVDLDHYMQSSINGQLGRLITYHDMFYVASIDETHAELKVAEDKIYKNACKFVDDYCKPYYSSYNTFGKTYQKIYKNVNKVLMQQMSQYDTLTSSLLSANVNLDKFETWVFANAEKEAVKKIGNYGEVCIEQQLAKIIVRGNDGKIDQSATKKAKDDKIKRLQHAYYGDHNSILHSREQIFKETSSILARHIREESKKIEKLYSTFHKGIQSTVETVKSKLNITNDMLVSKGNGESLDFKPDDLGVDKIEYEDLNLEIKGFIRNIMQNEQLTETLEKFKTLYQDIRAIHEMWFKTKSIVDYLKIKRNQNIRYIVRPNEIEDVIQQNIKEHLAEKNNEFTF